MVNESPGILKRIKKHYGSLLSDIRPEIVFITDPKNRVKTHGKAYAFRITKDSVEYRKEAGKSYSVLKCDFESELVTRDGVPQLNSESEWISIINQIVDDIKSKKVVQYKLSKKSR